MPIVLPEPGSATMTCQLRWRHAWRKRLWNRRSKGVSMKPSKRGRLRTVISLPPFSDTEWPGAPRKTLAPGQGWLRRAGGLLGQSEPGERALHPHTKDGSPRVADRTREPFPVFGELSPAAFWWFRCLPGSVPERSPLPPQRLLRLSYPLCALLSPPTPSPLAP